MRAGSEMAELYQARFEGAVPDVKAKDGVVTIRYPRRLWLLGGGASSGDHASTLAIPWWIVIQGGASEVTAELGGLDLAGLEVKGGMSMIHLELPCALWRGSHTNQRGSIRDHRSTSCRRRRTRPP